MDPELAEIDQNTAEQLLADIELDDPIDVDADDETDSTADDPDAEMDVEDELEAADVDDDDTEEDDPEPETAIEAPQFWGAEDKALFAELTPEAQEVVLKVDQQREAAVRRKIEESGTARKAAEERAKVYDQRLTELGGFVTETEQKIAAYEKINWVNEYSSAAGDPEALANVNAHKAQYDALIESRNKAAKAITDAEEQELADNRAAIEKLVPNFTTQHEPRLQQFLDSVAPAGHGFVVGGLPEWQIVMLEENFQFRQARAAARSGKNSPRPKSGAKSSGKGVKPGAATASSSQQTRRKKLARKKSLNMDEASALLGDL